MPSSQNPNHRGRPHLGTLPHFSQRSLSKMVCVLTLASIAIFPLIQISPRPIRASDPVFSLSIANYAFQPQHINIATGTELIWTNNDTTLHTVTSTNTTQGGGYLISSGPLNRRQNFSYVFYKHGFYPYECGFHTYMTGWVNVTGSDLQPPSPPVTMASIDYTPYVIAGLIAGGVVVVSAAIFVRRRTKN